MHSGEFDSNLFIRAVSKFTSRSENEKITLEERSSAEVYYMGSLTRKG